MAKSQDHHSKEHAPVSEGQVEGHTLIREDGGDGVDEESNGALILCPTGESSEVSLYIDTIYEGPLSFHLVTSSSCSSCDTMDVCMNVINHFSFYSFNYGTCENPKL